MLPKKNRINKKLFSEIFKNGKTIKGKACILKTSPCEKNQKKFAFVVPFSVSKNAAGRNLLRRRGKHIINTNKNNVPDGISIIFIFNKEASLLRYDDLKKDILLLLEKIRPIK